MLVEDEQEETLPPAAKLEATSSRELDPLFQKRLSIPGAETSSEDFEAMFARLFEQMAKDEILTPDPPREEYTLVGNLIRIMDTIKARHPE